jgi:hypothetical protein
MYNFLLHFSRYTTALNLTFTAYTLLSSTFRNCLSSLQQMEPAPSQVRNHYLQKNKEAHMERALTFRNAPNHHSPCNGCLPFVCVHAEYRGQLILQISLVQEAGDIDQEISHDRSEGNTEPTLSSNIEHEDLNSRAEVLHRGQASWEKSVTTTWDLFTKNPEPCQHSYCMPSAFKFAKTGVINRSGYPASG